MATTYTKLLFHLVFSTKNRQPLIDPQWQDRLYGYLGGTVSGLGGALLAIGGISDHVHMLVSLRPTHQLGDFMRELKKGSSSWVHDEIRLPAFAWQEGYAAFTFGGAGLAPLRAYLAGQDEHHRTVDSHQELLDLCEEAGIEVDMRYFE